MPGLPIPILHYDFLSIAGITTHGCCHLSIERITNVEVSVECVC